MKKIVIVLLGCIFLFSSTEFVNADLVSGVTAVVTPANDASVSEANPDTTNNSIYLHVFAGVGEGNFNTWSYAQFDLSDIPDNAVISKAWIQWYIYFYSCDGYSTNRYIDFWHVDDDSWDETTITWNNKPSYGYWLGKLTPTTTAKWYTFEIITAGSGVTDWVQPDLADNLFSMALTTPPDEYHKQFSGNASPGFYLELEYSYDDAIASVTTNPATAVTARSATLNGTVNPNGQATTCFFDFGADTSYGDTIAGTDPGSGSSGVSVTADVSGLSPDSTYHYRVVAVNSGGTAYGTDQSFTTGSINANAGMFLLLFQ